MPEFHKPDPPSPTAPDHTPGPKRAALVGDAAVSLVRQWLLRPEFHQPGHPAPKTPAGASMFRVLNDDPRLTPRHWISGAALSLLGWTAASLLIGPVPLHSLTMASSEGNTSEQRRTLAIYFRSVRVLSALDLNRDLIISPSEIANAPAALATLDKDRDGLLTAEELLPVRNP